MERTSGSVAESFRLPVTPAAAGMARGRLAEACAGLDAEQRYVAELLTSELVTNAVRHPHRHEDSPWADMVEVAIHRSDQCLRVEVFDPDPRPLKAPSCPSTPRESGWGLYLLSQLSTEWGCRAAEAGDRAGDGKVVWFEMGIAPRR